MPEIFDLDKLKQFTKDCHEVTIMFFDEHGRPLEGSGLNGSPLLMAALLERIEWLRRELATVRHYMNKDNRAMADEAMFRGEFLETSSYDLGTTPPPFGDEYTSLGEKRFLIVENLVPDSEEIYPASMDITPSDTSEDIGSAPSEKELGARELPPDAGAALVVKQADGSEILHESSGSALIGVDMGVDGGSHIALSTPVPDPLPNPVLLCECCAHRGKSWKYDPHCEKCGGTGWPDKGVWAKANPDETNYAMDLSMWLDHYRHKASEIAVRLVFHIAFSDGPRPFIDDAAVLVDAAMGADTRRIDLLEAFAGTSEDRGTRDKGLIVFPDGSIRGALPGDDPEKIGQTVREAIDKCTHEPRPAERDYVEGRTSDAS